MAHIHTGWIVIDEFAARFVYFYSGYVFAAHIFRFAEVASNGGWLAAGYLAVWAVVNGVAVFSGVSEIPGLGLALGFAGAVAVVTFATVLARTHWMEAIRYCGQHSIVIYLAFFLPMAASRTVLLKVGIIEDVGVISLIVTTAGVIVPLLMFWAVRRTPLRFLFERPEWTHIDVPRRRALVPAE
jgi:uncharacterized membrane protein YcfT